MEQRKETIICLEGLGKQFQTTNGTVTALDDINLEILKGEIFGIIGLSGAGKSTLVRCINYLETPTAGRVIFEGQNLSMMKEAEIRKARQIRARKTTERPSRETITDCPKGIVGSVHIVHCTSLFILGSAFFVKNYTYKIPPVRFRIVECIPFLKAIYKGLFPLTVTSEATD